jgi:hypothetical protein
MGGPESIGAEPVATQGFVLIQELENAVGSWTDDLTELTLLRDTLAAFIGVEDVSILNERIELLQRQWEELCHQVKQAQVWEQLTAMENREVIRHVNGSMPAEPSLSLIMWTEEEPCAYCCNILAKHNYMPTIFYASVLDSLPSSLTGWHNLF